MKKLVIFFLILCIIAGFNIGEIKAQAEIEQLMNLYKQAEIINVENSDFYTDFEYKAKVVLINVEINNKEKLKFILDTGSPTVIDKNIAQQLELKEEMDISVGDSSGEIRKNSITILDNLEIGSMKIKDTPVLISDLSMIQAIGYDINGILGSDILRFFKLIINYKEENIVFSTDKKFETKEETYNIKFDMDQMFIPNINFDFKGNKLPGLIDTAYNGYIAIPSALVIQNKEYFAERRMIESSGNMSKGAFDEYQENCYQLELYDFAIGDIEFDKIPIITSEYGLVGNEFLEKFTVVINYLSEELILIKNSKDFKRNIYDTGLSLSRNDVDEIIVSGLWEDSSAERAGILIGDKILEINDKKIEDYSLIEIWEILKDPLIENFNFLIIRDNKELTITIKKEHLLYPESDV
ncbi:MAG: aspartyl protease family protein [Halanaerobiales bacterium]